MDPAGSELTGFRLSPQQEQLLASGRPAEATQCAVLLDGPIDASRLREALDDVVGRHEILRTTFVQPPGMLACQQVIGAESGRAWSLTQEPSAVTPIADAAALEELMRREAQQEVDLSQGPPVRALLAGGQEAQALLLLSVWGGCADATSLLAIVHQLCAAYRGAAALIGEPVQYADYAEWRHELIAGEEAQEGRRHWREETSARSAQPRILFLQAETQERAQPAIVPVDLKAVELGDLQSAAVSAGAGAAVILEAAWHVLLARLSGAGELALAGWCDGRAQPDLAGAIGAYEQPTPIRSRTAQTTTFAEVVDQVRRSRALAARYQDCADADDLAALADQACAGWTFHAVGPLPAPARRLLALRPASGGTRLLLALRVEGSELTGQLQYDAAAVPSEDARELAARFQTILRSALADPSAPVAHLAIMDPDERDRLVSTAGAASVAQPPSLLHELIERHAQRTPKRLAVIGPSTSLTYAELDEAANRLANHLHLSSPVRGEAVGLCMERTPAMIVALMAILKAGGSYLPLNFEHPPARIRGQLLDAKVRVLITEQHVLAQLPSLDATAVCVDRDAHEIAARPAQRPELEVGLRDLAYVMYTSGSTGTPKGVAVTHGNIASYAISIASRLSPSERPAELVYGVVSAISTDLGNTSIFAPLVSGGCVRLIGAAASMDGELMAEELAGERLDVLKIAPSHLQALLAADVADALPTQWLIVGGEALTWELVERIRSLSPGCRILNHYGPTETTVGCATYAVDPQRREDSATVPIGFPLAGIRAHVLDGRMEPVPAGVPGELCVAGAGVASGYLGDAEQSGGGFTQDPFAPGSDAGRMYRTGDRVRRLRDGAIEFLGRLDDQLKIRGFRIEPGEVETALLAHSSIRQAAICAEEDHTGGRRLVAYAVCAEQPAVQELRAFLAARLPDHMIPATFRMVESLPLSASGKVDRGALAGMAELQAQREAEYVAPRDAVERQIAEIWGELLGVERVGAFDDFFALGGHSLLATQATMRIRRAYGEVPLRALLAAPTVAALADVVREQVDAGAAVG